MQDKRELMQAGGKKRRVILRNEFTKGKILTKNWHESTIMSSNVVAKPDEKGKAKDWERDSEGGDLWSFVAKFLNIILPKVPLACQKTSLASVKVLLYIVAH